MTNPFDNLGDYDDDLGGLFSKIKKSFRKVEKKVNTVRRKFNAKVLPKKLNKAVLKAEKNPKIRKAVKIAGAAAAIYFTGGAAAGALKAGATKFMASGLAKKAVGTLAMNALKAKSIKMQHQALPDRITVNELGEDVRQATAAVTSPEFQEVAARLRAQGYSAEQIQQVWAQSQGFKNLAVPQVARTIYPQVVQAYAQTMPEDLAREKALVTSHDIAESEVNKVGGIDAKTIFTVAVPIVAALLLQG